MKQYIKSKRHSYVIANAAQTGTTVNLGRPYKTILVECWVCTNIAGSTAMGANVGVDSSSTMCVLYEQDDPSTVWSQGAIPDGATAMAFALTHAFGFQMIQLDLDTNTTGEVTFYITGIDQGA